MYLDIVGGAQKRSKLFGTQYSCTLERLQICLCHYFPSSLVYTLFVTFSITHFFEIVCCIALHGLHRHVGGRSGLSMEG